MQWYEVDLHNARNRHDTVTWTGKADSAFEAEKVAEVAYMGFVADSVREA